MDVDLCDPKLYQMITSTEPIGVSPEDIDCPTSTLSIPEMGTPFVLGMLMEAQPKLFRFAANFRPVPWHGCVVGQRPGADQNGVCTILM